MDIQYENFILYLFEQLAVLKLLLGNPKSDIFGFLE